MEIKRERSTRARESTWFARQLGDGWTSGGDGIYYPPEPGQSEPEPVLAVSTEPVEVIRPAADRRRGELFRLRERLVERVARFPNAVAERQLRELEHEIAALARKFGPLHVARPS
jgi:hypothetical protein